MKIKKLYDREGNVYTPLVSIDSVYNGDSSIRHSIEDSVSLSELYNTVSKQSIITIESTDWSNNTCRVTMDANISQMSIIVSADPLSEDEYILHNIECVNQGNDYLDFHCSSTPTTDLTINIICIKSRSFKPVKSLSVSGDWSYNQYTNTKVNYEGLTFTVTYTDDTTDIVIPDKVYPIKWNNILGTQVATFIYDKASVTKNADVINIREVPLTLRSIGNGNISITKAGDPGTVYYSLNDGPQTELISDTNIPVNIGDEVSFYRTLSNNLDGDNYFTIKCTNNCYVYGNIMSLINKDNFTNLDTIDYSYAFNNLFYRNTYININELVGKLILPATTLTEGCYKGMFNGCKSLTTTAPELPATTLAKLCYCNMFNGCKSLITAPELPATILAEGCYMGMFFGCTSLINAPPIIPANTLVPDCCNYMFAYCTSLTTAPDLPATTLASQCYYCMFINCNSLTTPPELPATTLATSCYYRMFRHCTSLTKSPELSATKLASNCYNGMFSGCTNLNEITCLATDISATSCTTSWVDRVSSTGTFIKDSSMTDWTTGDSGIPSGWTVTDK